MRHVWNEQFGALYNRTYRVLYDAGINEKLADELAIQRVLAVAFMPRRQSFRVLFGRSIGRSDGPESAGAPRLQCL
jgi:hypothetical protein